MTLFEQFLTAAGKNGTRPALSYLGKETSYSDLKVSISKLSYLFQNELGAHPKVILIAQNSPAFIKTFFALTNIRATITPLDPNAPPSDWAKSFHDTKPTHVAITSDLLMKVREFLNSEHLFTPIIEIEKKQGGEYDTTFTPPPDAKPTDADPILLFRSHGTTGKPKFAVINHKQVQSAFTGIRSLYKSLPSDRVLTTLNWSHPFSFIHALLFPLMNGLTVVIDHGLQAVDFLNFITETRANRLIGTPSFYHKLVVVCRNEKRPLVGIKSATVGLGNLSHDMKRVFKVMKIPAPHVYGQVENMWSTSMESVEDIHSEEGFIGKGFASIKYRVMNEAGDEILTKGPRVGLLTMSSPAVMTGYLGKENEMATKQVLRGSWLYTGDYAALEGEGETLKIRLIGRKEDILLIDGLPSNLDEMDHVLKKIPGLSDAAGFTAINSKNHPVPLAALVRVAGSPLNEVQVMEFCQKNLSAGLVPKSIIFVDVIPRDNGGNVNHHKLRNLYSGLAG